MAEIVKVILNNRTAQLVCPYPYESFIDILKFRVDGWEFMKDRYGHYVNVRDSNGDLVLDQDNAPVVKWVGWDGYIKMLKDDTMGAGLFLAMKEKLERAASCLFLVKDNRRPPNLKDSPVVSDRPYQMQCLKQMLKARTGGLILNATGTGKTYIAGMYFSRVKGSGVFIVDELTLLKQAQAELSKVMGEDVGQVGKGIFDPKRITVATVQTLHLHRKDQRFRPWTKSIQAMILDEVHLALNKRSFDTVASILPPVVFGLTATLELRKKRIALQSYATCGPVIFDYPLEKGVKEGYLAPGVVVFVDFENDFQRQRWDNFAKEYERAIVTNSRRLNLVCSLVQEAIAREKYVTVLVERIKHIEALHSALGKIPHRVVCGSKKVDERLSSKQMFEKGQIRLLIVTKVFKKGIDIKRLDVIIDAAAGASKNDAVQKYGRGIRTCEGKNGLLYFDIADKTPSGRSPHRFEKAATSRRAALKSRGLVSGRATSQMSPKYIFDRAEMVLKKVIDSVPKKEAVA